MTLLNVNTLNAPIKSQRIGKKQDLTISHVQQPHFKYKYTIKGRQIEKTYHTNSKNKKVVEYILVSY